MQTPQISPDNGDLTTHDPRQHRSTMYSVCIALMAVLASVMGLNVAQPQWAGVVVMALLLIFVLLRGPENSTITKERNTDAV